MVVRFWSNQWRRWWVSHQTRHKEWMKDRFRSLTDDFYCRQTETPTEYSLPVKLPVPFPAGWAVEACILTRLFYLSWHSCTSWIETNIMTSLHDSISAAPPNFENHFQAAEGLCTTSMSPGLFVKSYSLVHFCWIILSLAFTSLPHIPLCISPRACNFNQISGPFHDFSYLVINSKLSILPQWVSHLTFRFHFY